MRLPGCGCLGCAGLHADLRTPPALRVTDHFLVLNAILTHGLWMRQCPTVGKKIEQVGRAGSKVGRMVLLGVGKPSQHILQIVLDHQMMAMRTANHAVHLQPARCRAGMAKEHPVVAAMQSSA